VHRILFHKSFIYVVTIQRSEQSIQPEVRKEVIDAMRKILVLLLPLLLLSLVTIQASAILRPVSVENIKGFCFIRVRADRHSMSYLFHYENLSPVSQVYVVSGAVYDANGDLLWGLWFYPNIVEPGNSDDDIVQTIGLGEHSLHFIVIIDDEPVFEDWVAFPGL
jgi:hypothetical protein